MVINSLVALRARGKCARVVLGRFSSLRCASSGPA